MFVSLNLLVTECAADDAVVVTIHAPPANFFLQALHFHIPTASRFTVFFPHNPQAYFACCDISNFMMFFLRDAPYLTPYFPVIPTFFVCRYIMIERQITNLHIDDEPQIHLRVPDVFFFFFWKSKKNNK